MSTASCKIARSLASNPIFPSTFALRSHRVCSYTLWNFSEFLSLDTGFWASQNWATQRIESHPRVTNALSSPSSTSRRFKKKKLHFFPACRAVMIFSSPLPPPKETSRHLSLVARLNHRISRSASQDLPSCGPSS